MSLEDPSIHRSQKSVVERGSITLEEKNSEQYTNCDHVNRESIRNEEDASKAAHNKVKLKRKDGHFLK